MSEATVEKIPVLSSADIVESMKLFLAYSESVKRANSKRHHRACDILADKLKPDWKTIWENRVTTVEGDTRFTDIVAISKNEKIGYMLDPTIRNSKFKKKTLDAIFKDSLQILHHHLYN